MPFAADPTGKSFSTAPPLLRRVAGVVLGWIILDAALQTAGFTILSGADDAFGATFTIFSLLLPALFWLSIYGVLIVLVARGSDGARNAVIVLKALGLAFAVVAIPLQLVSESFLGFGGDDVAYFGLAGVIGTVVVNAYAVWGLTRPEVVSYTRPVPSPPGGSMFPTVPSSTPASASLPQTPLPPPPVADRTCPVCGEQTPGALSYCTSCRAVI